MRAQWLERTAPKTGGRGTGRGRRSERPGVSGPARYWEATSTTSSAVVSRTSSMLRCEILNPAPPFVPMYKDPSRSVVPCQGLRYSF